MMETEAEFNDMAQDLQKDNTVSIYVSSDGSSGPKVSINKALLLTIEADDLLQSDNDGNITWANATNGTTADNFWSVASTQTKTQRDVNKITFASETYAAGISLGSISVGVFTQALENIATLRADNGGTMSRLQYASDNATLQTKNLRAANGRIVDVDIAREYKPWPQVSDTCSGICLDDSGQLIHGYSPDASSIT